MQPLVTKDERAGTRAVQVPLQNKVQQNIAGQEQNIANLDAKIAMQARGEQFVEGMLSKFAELGITNPALIARILSCEQGTDWSQVI